MTYIEVSLYYFCAVPRRTVDGVREANHGEEKTEDEQQRVLLEQQHEATEDQCDAWRQETVAEDAHALKERPVEMTQRDTMTFSSS